MKIRRTISPQPAEVRRLNGLFHQNAVEERMAAETTTIRLPRNR